MKHLRKLAVIIAATASLGLAAGTPAMAATAPATHAVPATWYHG